MQTVDFERSADGYGSATGTMRAAVYTGAEHGIALALFPCRESDLGKFSSAWKPAASATRISRRSSMTCCRLPASSGMRQPGLWRRWARASRGSNRATGVIAFHHVPCRDCFYCEHKLYAQCPGYKRVGITAGYGEPAGGGFAQYVRVMDWIVRDGVEKIPARCLL